MTISLSPAEDAGFGFSPSPSGSGEIIMSIDRKAIISFLDSSEHGRVAAICDRVFGIKSGYPNDEPRSWIPRFESVDSMEAYIPLARVLNNDWADEISKDNKHKFPESDYVSSDLQHLVFQFKESTTEVLCKTCRFETDLTYESVFELAQKEFG